MARFALIFILSILIFASMECSAYKKFSNSPPYSSDPTCKSARTRTKFTPYSTHKGAYFISKGAVKFPHYSKRYNAGAVQCPFASLKC